MSAGSAPAPGGPQAAIAGEKRKEPGFVPGRAYVRRRHFKKTHAEGLIPEAEKPAAEVEAVAPQAEEPAPEAEKPIAEAEAFPPQAEEPVPKAERPVLEAEGPFGQAEAEPIAEPAAATAAEAEGPILEFDAPMPEAEESVTTRADEPIPGVDGPIPEVEWAFNEAADAETEEAETESEWPGRQKVLTEETLNDAARRCRYGVRGEIYQRAQELVRHGHKVIFTSLGNPHQLGQRPLTFVRQVMALCAAPFLMDDPVTAAAFPKDAIVRAKEYLRALDGGLGAYQDSKGAAYMCEEVCDFIARRDGDNLCPKPEDIFITNGASEAVRLMLQVMIRDDHDGILVPVPQYPLFSASIALYGGRLVGYNLVERQGWALNMERLEAALQGARAEGIEVRAVIAINPGNPTGQCLETEQLRGLVRFAFEHRLVLFADEVYQENIYVKRPFASFHKVLHDMGEPYATSQELVSFHSASKGTAGECGIRAGYMHLCNFDETVRAHLYKLVSINLGPTVPGVVALACYLRPPQPGDASYESDRKERAALRESLERRARTMSAALSAIPGVSCQPVEGALYAFPRIAIPAKALAEAEELGMAPDMMYCLQLLKEEFVAVTPGSSFEQEGGTFHFRTTILAPEEDFDDLVGRFRRFHIAFTARFAA